MSQRSQDTLYKYCSAETAKLILASQSLRWSASQLYADPLELNYQSELPFNNDDLLSAAIKAATSFIFAKDPPSGRAPLMAAIRRWRDEERFASPEEAETVLHDLLTQMVTQRIEEIEQIVTDWKAYTRKMRICCFSAKADDLNSWYKYGDNHRGVILRFHNEGSAYFGKAEQVKYSDNKPAISSMKEQLNTVLVNDGHRPQDYFQEKFLSKPLSYKSEQEWRCFFEQKESDAPIDEDPNKHYLDRPFNNDDLKAVHFGTATSLADQKEIWDIIKSNYSLVKMFETTLGTTNFELKIDRVNQKPS
ncbi:DUF2971 domain-containing protein [Aurantivibrio infirmus]